MLEKNSEMKAMWNKDVAVQIYDELAENTNASFPEFMERAFHCPRKNGEIIRAGREIVADHGLFVKKKKYAVMVYDKEGKRYDKDGKQGKLKVTGFDMKRSDTPKFVQVFLETVLTDVLAGVPKETIMDNIKEFKKKLREMDPWTKGSPKGVRRITDYTVAQEKANNGKGSSKVNMPGHVRASLNWNYLRKMNGDNYSQKIVDGMKIIVCKLKDNPLGLTSVAYPTDELRLPKWFLELPFDIIEMERVLLDSKIDNMLEVLKWDIPKNTDINSTFTDLFSFG
jgi:DNA polymerase elongation subunit (family B)